MKIKQQSRQVNLPAALSLPAGQLLFIEDEIQSLLVLLELMAHSEASRNISLCIN